MLNSLLYIIILIVLLFLTPDRFEPFSYIYNSSLSIVFMFLAIIFLNRQRKFTKNWLRFDVIFLIGFAIVHIQIPFLASIGIEPLRPNFIWINKYVVNFATWMSVVAITLWMWGHTLGRNRNSLTETSAYQKVTKINYQVYDFILFLALIVFISLAGPVFLSGSYYTKGWGEGANYSFLILRILLYLRIIYFLRDIPKNASIRRIMTGFISHGLFFIVLLAYTLLFLRT